MFLNLRTLLLTACTATSIAQTASVHPKVPSRKGDDSVHVDGGFDVAKRLSVADDGASPRSFRVDTLGMATRTQVLTVRRAQGLKSRPKVPDVPGISKSCRRGTDLTAALAAAYDLALRARDNKNTQLWTQ